MNEDRRTPIQKEDLPLSTPVLGLLQRAGLNAGPTVIPAIVNEVLRSPGQSLDSATGALMGSRFGYDFSNVRVHTDMKAAESARSVNALAYTVGRDIAFSEGSYQPTTDAGRRLLAHELTHVVQQHYAHAAVRATSLTLGDPNDQAERQAERMANVFDQNEASFGGPLHGQPTSTVTLRRQPASNTCPPKTTSIRVEFAKPPSTKCLNQGKGGSGAIVYEYPAYIRKEPSSKDDEKQGRVEAELQEIKLPVLVYPPATLKSPIVDIFVFFHGHRADLGERASGGEGAKPQGSEPIAVWSHLRSAIASTERIGIVPQAPKTWEWIKNKKKWQFGPFSPWHDALGKIGFDGLINLALGHLTRDLKLGGTLLGPGTIHVAGHSGGGKGIGEATELTGGSKLYGDKVQAVTLQDAGYGFTSAWASLMNWFINGNPGKTVRILVSQAESRNTRNILKSWFNKGSLEGYIQKSKQSNKTNTDTFEVIEKGPKSDDNKPRPGGFILESHIEVKKNGRLQGTMVAFFSPGGGHYEAATATMGAAATAGPSTAEDFLGEAKPGQYRVISRATTLYLDRDLNQKAKPVGRIKDLVLARDTLVQITELKPSKKDKTKISAYVKTTAGEGWTPLANLAPLTP